MSRGWLRLRAFVDRHYGLVVAALVVLALVAGWFTYTAYATPETRTEQRTVLSWSTTGEFEHGATVVEENSVFPRDSELRNRTIYFRSIAPTLDGTFRAGYADADRGDLSVRVNLTLVTRSVGGVEERRTEYWRVNRSLGDAESASVSPDESVAVPFSIDTNAVDNRTERIRDELGGASGDVNTTVRATVQYAGTVDGKRVEREETYVLPVEIAGGVYRVDDPGTVTDRHETTRTETVTEHPELPPIVGGAFLFGASLAGAISLVVARRRDLLTPTEAEREWLAFREDREDFDEWIVTMRLPDEVEDMPRAEASTLSDLVDFAIDTDNAVIEHPDAGTFAVVHDGYRYVYSPPADPRTRNADDADDGRLAVGHPFGESTHGDADDASDHDAGEREDAADDSAKRDAPGEDLTTEKTGDGKPATGSGEVEDADEQRAPSE